MEQNKLKLEDCCLTYEQVKELQELGVDMSKSCLLLDCYGFPVIRDRIERTLKQAKKMGFKVSEYIPTLTNTEMLEMLPKEIDGYKLTFDFGTSEQEISTSLQLTTFTQEELNTALTDVEPSITTTSFVSGKIAVVSDFEGNMTATFNANGTYSETSSDGTCTGQWKDFGSNKIGVTCEDAGTTAIPDSVASQTTNILQFASSTPAVNGIVTVTEPGIDSYLMTIVSISNIAN